MSTLGDVPAERATYFSPPFLHNGFNFANLTRYFKPAPGRSYKLIPPISQEIAKANFIKVLIREADGNLHGSVHNSSMAYLFHTKV
jgi:hypothetical protein